MCVAADGILVHADRYFKLHHLVKIVHGMLYFQQFSNLPIPQDMEHPVHNLDEMMQFRIPIGMYENPVRGYTQ